MLLLPAINVGVGAALGHLIVRFTRPPRDFERAAVAAVAFGNSTGLPITLLTTIHASFGPLSELGQVNPVLFLSVYLLLYPLLQWTVAARLLGVDDELAQHQQQQQQQQQQREQQQHNPPPVVGLLLYRKHVVSGLPYIGELIHGLEQGDVRRQLAQLMALVIAGLVGGGLPPDAQGKFHR